MFICCLLQWLEWKSMSWGYGYEGVEFVDLIEFGWLLQVGHFMLNLDASNKGQNQAGARCNPCQARFSPRKGSEHLRIIMNFSYAHNETAINAWISNNMYIDKN